MKYLILAVMLFSAQLMADDYYLYTGGWSYHFEGEGKGKEGYNENNQLIGFEFHTIVGGIFKNTYNDRSFYLGRKWSKETDKLEFGIALGGVYGYYKCYGPKDEKEEAFGQRTLPTLCPLVSPYIVYKAHKYFQPTLMVHGNALALTFRWGLGSDK